MLGNMTFKEVVGQSDVKDYLVEAIRQDRLSHAMLFLGPSGYGSLALALALAQYLLCENPEDGDSCGKCSQCHKSSRFIHADIHFTYPTIGSQVTSIDLIKEWRQFLSSGFYQGVQDWLHMLGGENKQGNITKAECSRILKALSLKTYEGRYKIQIVWMAEYLGVQGNRLLKMIEEPPDNTVFILIAEDQDSILNTILSRCQLVSIKPASDDVIMSHLKIQRSDLDEKALERIVFLANGNVGAALKLADNPEQVVANNWLDWMRITYKGSGIDMVKWTDEFNKINRESQKNFMQYGLHFVREMLLTKVDEHHEIRLPEKEAFALRRLVNLVDLESIQEIVETIDASIYHLARNANVRILMLDLSIGMHYLLRNDVGRLQLVRDMTGKYSVK